MRNQGLRRGILAGLGCLALAGPAAAASAKDDDDRPAAMPAGPREPGKDRSDRGADSDSMFGFTEGSDTVEAGERELSYEVLMRRRGGLNSYSAADSVLRYEQSMRDDLKLGVGAGLDRYRLSPPEGADEDEEGIPGLGKRRSLVSSLSGEAKYRLLERGPSPVGLSVSLEPEWRRVVSGRGRNTRLVQLQTKLMADVALVPDRVFAAVNLSWEPQATWAEAGRFVRDTNVEASAAIAARVWNGIFLGGEIRYLASFDGLAFRKAPSYGVFVGPTLQARLSDRVALGVAWSARIGGVTRSKPEPVPDFGNVPDPGERHHLRVKFGYSF